MAVDGKILIKNDEGKDILCDVLFTSDSDEAKRSYIVYTDNSKDELGNVKVYANIFDSLFCQTITAPDVTPCWWK